MPGQLENVEDAYALTPVQEGMLYHSISDPGAGVYLEQYECTIEGALEPERFQAAWHEVYQRHPALRSIVLWEDLDAPLQVVRERVDLPWTMEDWQSQPADDQQARFASWLQRDRQTGLDLAKAPLTRFFMARLSPDRWRFVWTFHHANLDGWSLGLVLDQVLAAYGDAVQAPAPPPFGDFVHWLEDRDLETAEQHWRPLLEGYEEPAFPEIHPVEPASTARPARHRHALPPALWKKIQAFARDHRLTPNTIVHGAWALVLHQFTGRDDLVFGSTVSGRPASLPGVESMVGCFLNTLPLRVRIGAGDSLQGWLAALQEQHVAMRDFEFSGLASVQKWSDLPAGVPLFESIVVFENLAGLPTGTPDGKLRFSGIELHEQSNFALALQAIPHPEDLQLIYNFDPDRLPPRGVESIAACFEAILHALVSQPSATLRELVVLPEVERHRIDRFSRGPALEPPPRNAMDLFDSWVRTRPDAVAVCHRDTELSYKELNRRADHLATALSAAGISPGDRVGLCIERSPEMVIGIWGILKAGGAYVPMDPSYPESRLQQMLDDSGAALLLSRGGLLSALSAPQRLDFEAVPESSGAPPPPLAPEQLAYVIFTSGSTGRPKGVGVAHANLAASLAARAQHYRDPVGRFLLLSSFSFDSSIVGLFWTLCTGGTLVLPGVREEQDLEVLVELVERHEVTHTLGLPSLYALLLEHAPPRRLSSLRVAIMAGEECPASLCRSHHAKLPSCELHNEYGPTEATVWCTAWQPPPSTQLRQIPIGRPIAGARIHLLDPHGRPVPTGVPGDIHVGGAGVVPGYLAAPTATDEQERFLPSPFEPDERLYRTGDLACWLPDGNLLFLGRADRQVKVRGHRIEPAEIETALRSHPAVKDAVVLASCEALADDADSLLTTLQNLDPDHARQLLAQVTS